MVNFLNTFFGGSSWLYLILASVVVAIAAAFISRFWGRRGEE